MANTLREVSRLVERRRQALKTLEQRRDELIREAISDGHSHAEIQRMLDGQITRARIGQIAKER